ncbi:RING/U-box superfamily protein [Actinidia rufa]|uniref:RING-type E3 ubiquitin transferase n=1 Tax=Actinidia rufa TaxID=165716 RepID=A0A7J0GZM0_9ERIC|nr:RING/U-box superfamily protein [Actinidia rufa]
MNDRFPDATPEELNASDATCIICREEMTTAKRLSCGHLFHVHCLRSWLERQHTCPTCRALVTPPENGTTGSQASGFGIQTEYIVQIGSDIVHFLDPISDLGFLAFPGAGVASTPHQSLTGDGVANDIVRQHQARLQAAAAAASIYERSFVYPPNNTSAWSPGYALLPQAYRPLDGTVNADSSGERSFDGQSQQHPSAIPVGPANLATPQSSYSSFVPFFAPGSDVNFEERFGSNLNAQDSQLEAQKKFIQNQIKILQNQLDLLLKSRIEKSIEVSPTSSSDCKGKAVASSSSSVSDCTQHGEAEERERESR